MVDCSLANIPVPTAVNWWKQAFNINPNHELVQHCCSRCEGESKAWKWCVGLVPTGMCQAFFGFTALRQHVSLRAFCTTYSASVGVIRRCLFLSPFCSFIGIGYLGCHEKLELFAWQKNKLAVHSRKKISVWESS